MIARHSFALALPLVFVTLAGCGPRQAPFASAGPNPPTPLDYASWYSPEQKAIMAEWLPPGAHDNFLTNAEDYLIVQTFTPKPIGEVFDYYGSRLGITWRYRPDISINQDGRSGTPPKEIKWHMDVRPTTGEDVCTLVKQGPGAEIATVLITRMKGQTFVSVFSHSPPIQ